LLTSRPGRFIPEKETRYPLNRRLSGPYSWSRCFDGEEEEEEEEKKKKKKVF